MVWSVFVAMLVTALLPFAAIAQRRPSPSTRNRPFITEQPTPSTEEAPGERDLGDEPEERILPTVPLPSDAELDALGAQSGLVIRTLELEGNTVVDDETLTKAAAPYLGRPLDSADLERLRRALTAVYVGKGYVNSGARLPEQVVSDGRLRVEITEGRLSEIRIVGAGRYRESVLRGRLERAVGPPLRVPDLESALRILAQDPRIARLDARLEPGLAPGSSTLLVAMEEADPGSLVFSSDNYQSPSVGSYAGYADAAHLNPLGLGDRLGAGVTVSEGLYRVEGAYSIPIHPSGTELTAEARYSDARILDNFLEELEIGNESLSYAFGIRQTFYRTPQDWIEAGLSFDIRESWSTISGGDPFSFSAGTDNGRSELRVLRADMSWTRRMRSSALTLRSIASAGLDVLGATMHHGNGAPPPLPDDPDPAIPIRDLPEGVFYSWVGQLRYFYRFDTTGVEVDLRGDLQLADRSLLSLEQFVIGGPGSVRGYRTNQLAGDEGFSSGLEVRLPLVRTATGRKVLFLAPFAEVGRVWWKEDRESPGKRTLTGLGAGLEWDPHPALSFRVDWAGALRDSGLHSNMQDNGVTFRMTWRAR